MRKGDDSRARMVGAMADLVQRQGYLGTGLNEVVARSSAPKGSMYHHFPGGKEELGVAAIEQAAAGIEHALERLFSATRSPAAAMERLVDAMAANLSSSAYERGCPVATVALETAHTSERLAEACARGFNGWAERIAGALERAGHSPAAARDRATLALSALEGALILARAQRDVEPLRRVRRQLAPLLRPTH